MVSSVLSIAAAVQVAKEIEEVVRLNRRDENNKRSGPVVVTLSRPILRDNIQKKKGGLVRVSGFEQVRI